MPSCGRSSRWPEQLLFNGVFEELIYVAHFPIKAVFWVLPNTTEPVTFNMSCPCSTQILEQLTFGISTAKSRVRFLQSS